MKIKLSDTTPIQINWLVATLECRIPAQFTSVPAMLNGTVRVFRGDTGQYSDPIEPATNWAHGGPIIEREFITVGPYHGDGGKPTGVFQAYMGWDDKTLDPLFKADGPTTLIAAMRCYVASRLGDEVEVPDELC